MQDTYGEYSLPYIDKQYENKRIKAIVNFLIDEEKNNSEPLVIQDTPGNSNDQFQIEFGNDLPLPVKYESLSREKLLLQELILRRKELWGNEIKDLATYISMIEDKQRVLKEEINNVNVQRANAQREAELRLLRLKKQINDMESLIENEKRETERLNFE